jgi:hypothetical protein
MIFLERKREKGIEKEKNSLQFFFSLFRFNLDCLGICHFKGRRKESTQQHLMKS